MIIRHQIPETLGKQKLHVTLKAASLDPKANVDSRIHREVLEVGGAGQVEVDFEVPASVMTDAVRIAAFIGEDFQSNLEYLQSPAIPVDK